MSDDPPVAGAEAGQRRPPRWRAALPALAVALLALLLQARAVDPALDLSDTDAAKYLALARDAPAHRLFDGHRYLMHPPGYPWAVAALAALGPGLPAAAPLLGGLCVAGLAVVVLGLGRRWLSLPAAGVAVLLLLWARGTALLGQGAWREPLQTLLAFGAVLLCLPPRGPESPGTRRARAAAAAGLGALMGLVWDPLVLLVPLLLGAAWLLRRREAALLAAALLVTWLGWAGARWHLLRSAPAYPAGIDGTWEDSRQPPAGAFFNPNLLPRTARHNAYFWPAAATPLRPLEAFAPWFAGPAGPVLETLPRRGLEAAGLALLALALAGATLWLRPPPPRWRELLVVVAVGGLLGGPGLLGRTPRYGFALLVPAALLAARAIEPLLGRLPAAARGRVVVAAAAALLCAWWATQPHFAWGRPLLLEGHGVARALERVGLEPRAVAAPVNLSPDLCWALPGRRVVTLPFEGEQVEPLLAAREVELIVLPHEQRVLARPGVDPALGELVQGIPGLRAVHQGAAAGRYAHLGVVLEVTVADRPRVRSYDLFWRGERPPPAFGLLLAPEDLDGLRAAVEAGAASEETLRLLRAAAPLLERRLSHPAQGPAARALLEALQGTRQ